MRSRTALVYTSRRCLRTGYALFRAAIKSHRRLQQWINFAAGVMSTEENIPYIYADI